MDWLEVGWEPELVTSKVGVWPLVYLPSHPWFFEKGLYRSVTSLRWKEINCPYCHHFTAFIVSVVISFKVLNLSVSSPSSFCHLAFLNVDFKPWKKIYCEKVSSLNLMKLIIMRQPASIKKSLTCRNSVWLPDLSLKCVWRNALC